MQFRLLIWNQDQKRWHVSPSMFNSYEHAVKQMVWLLDHTELKVAVVRRSPDGVHDMTNLMFRPA